MAFDPDKYLSEKLGGPADPAASPESAAVPAPATSFDPDAYLAEKAPASPPSTKVDFLDRAKRGLAALFPGAHKDYAPQQSAMPWTFDMATGRPLTRERGQAEQRMVAGVGDALSAPTRIAGATAGSLGYDGATGGDKPFLDALADPQTGLARPLREGAANMVAESLSGGEDGERGILDYSKAAAGALGYVAGSVVEDPTAIVGGIAKLAPKAVGKLAAKATVPVQKVAQAAAPGVRSRAERVQQTVLKPRAGDWDAGFDLKDVGKYGLQGSADEVLTKAQTQIDEAAGKLQQLIREGKDGGARVDLGAALHKARARLNAEADADLLEQADPIFERFQRWAQLESSREGGNSAGAVDLLQAHKFKQMMGTHGAWEKTAAKTRQTITQPERYQSRAAQVVYMTLKEEIENAAPAGVKDINKVLSDLIPIRNAAMHRKIVAERNNPIDLSGMLSLMTATGNLPAGAAMFAASRLTTKGPGAKLLYGAANKLDRLAAPADPVQYSRTLRDLGYSAAEAQAITASGELPKIIPFRLRDIAQGEDTKKPRRFSLRDLEAR
jgi:hypothetical protein